MPSAGEVEPGQPGEQPGGHPVHHADDRRSRLSGSPSVDNSQSSTARTSGCSASKIMLSQRKSPWTTRLRRGRAGSACPASRPARPCGDRGRPRRRRDIASTSARPDARRSRPPAIVAKADRGRIDSCAAGRWSRSSRRSARRGCRASGPGKCASHTIRPATMSITKKAVPMTPSSSHRPWTRGTGKPVVPSAAITRVSRSTAWAPGKQSCPAACGAGRRTRPGCRAVGRVGLAALELADRQRAGEAGDIGRPSSVRARPRRSAAVR